ncbi:MAG TPA: SRPBCC family protein [Kofleriaceae bacterium]|nr:SRPBCC family protein [Kofleriaceae bacterium]
METQMTQEMDVGDRPGTKLGKGLGWFSIGLGLTELIAPRGLARFIGIQDDGKTPLVMRLFGLREIAAGAMLLARPTNPLGGWNRVAGDLIDLVTMGIAMRHSTSTSRNVFALANVLGVTALDVMHGVRESRRKMGNPVRRAITIGRSREDVYSFYRKLELLPKFMNWIESVEELGNGMTHWKVKTPAGTIEYDAEITEDVPGRRISWRTLPNATIPNRGVVEFLDAPGDRGCEVVLEMQVAAPLGKTIASQEAMGDLRRLKQIMELGEIVKSDASIHKAPHPAQPEGEMQ